MRALRLDRQGRPARARADPGRHRGARADAPPRRQRRRRGRRLRAAHGHPARAVERGGPPRRPRLQAGARPALHRPPPVHPAHGRARGAQGPRARAAEQVRAAHPGRAPRRGRVQRARPHRARGGAALLADRRRDRRPAPDLRADDPARVRARPARGQLLHRHRGLQGARRPAGARRLLPRPARPAREDRRGLRPQPLLDQDLAGAQARAALRHARPQRRDQHDRPAAPGGEDDRRPARRGDVGLARTSTARSSR